MIDIENEIIDEITTMLENYDDKIFVSSDSSKMPPSFPAVFIAQTDGFLADGYHVSTHEENFRSVTFEIDVYTNDLVGRKSHAKQISKLINDRMRQLNFTEQSSNPLDLTTTTNSALCRYKSVFRANIGKDGVIYQR